MYSIEIFNIKKKPFLRYLFIYLNLSITIYLFLNLGSEALSTDESDTEEVVADPLPIRRQRSHNRAMCMLCSVNEHSNRSVTRNRKVSSSSLRRCRTGLCLSLKSFFF